MTSLKKQASPLLFLTLRQTVNGVRRALTSPRRLITLIFIIGYYFLFFIRPVLFGRAGGNTLPSRISGGVPEFSFPPLQVVDAVVFTILAFLSVIMLLGVMAANSNYKQADVDVLFATPVSAKTLLVFRLLRDYLVTLIFPLFIALFGIYGAKAAWQALFRNMPEYSGLALKLLGMSWLLMALCWVAVSYAVSLYTNRGTPAADAVKKWAPYVMLSGIVFVGLYCKSQITGTGDVGAEVLHLLQSPVLRSVFFMASFSTQIVMSPLHEHGLAGGLMGLAGLLAVFAGSWALALKQAPWLYDQAAIKAFNRDKMRNLQKSGDFMGMVAERARQGKFKVKSNSWLHRLKVSGPKSLLWVETLLHFRTMRTMVMLNFVVGAMMFVMPALVARKANSESLPGFMLLFMGGMYAFSSTTMVAISGFIELNRRTDLLRPLPFTARQIVISEILAKAMLSMPALPLALVTPLVNPSLWGYSLALLVALPGIAILMTSVTFLVSMVFPDAEENSQRQFKGLLTMLGVLVGMILPGGSFAVVLALKLSPIVGGLCCLVLALLESFALTLIASPLYENFNPSE